MFFVIKINDVLNIYNYDIEYFILNRLYLNCNRIQKKHGDKIFIWENYRIIINYNKFLPRMYLYKIYYCTCKFSKFLFFSFFKEYIYFHWIFSIRALQLFYIVLLILYNLYNFQFLNYLIYFLSKNVNIAKFIDMCN